jgi:hypothetical protein
MGSNRNLSAVIAIILQFLSILYDVDQRAAVAAAAIGIVAAVDEFHLKRTATTE